MYHDFPIGRFQPGWQLFTLIFLSFLFGFAFTQVFQLIVSQLYGPSLFDDLLGLSKTALGRDLLRWSQVVTTAGVFLVPALAFTYYYDHERDFTINEVKIQLNSMRLWGKIALGLAIGILAIPISTVFYELATSWEPAGGFGEMLKNMRDSNTSQNAVLENLISDNAWYGPAVNLLVIAGLAPVAEELFFRAGLMRLILRWNERPHAAIWITALVFGLVHFDFDGLLSRVLLGAAMGYIYIWSGHILVPIALHLAYNGTAVATEMIVVRSNPDFEIDRYFTEEAFVLTVGSVVLASFALYISHRMRQSGVVGAMLAEVSPSPFAPKPPEDQELN